MRSFRFLRTTRLLSRPLCDSTSAMPVCFNPMRFMSSTAGVGVDDSEGFALPGMLQKQCLTFVYAFTHRCMHFFYRHRDCQGYYQ